jgi:hypothetical protein
MPVFAVSLIFLSPPLFANTNFCAQPHLPLLSDTREYQCSRSASHSPPVRYSQILVFALSLVFLSSHTCTYQCLCSGSYSSLLIYSQVPCSRSQMPVVALRLIYPSSQIVANISVRAQDHIPLLHPDRRKYQCSLLSDRRKYQCSHSASYSPPLRSSQLPVFSLSLIFASSQILANTSVRAQAHIPSCQILANTSVLARKCVRAQVHIPLPPDCGK